MSPAFRPGPTSRDRIAPEDRLERFSARIFKIGINPVVDVPEKVSGALGARGSFPVAGLLNDVPIRATLVPAGAGRHRLYLNTAMREAAGVAAGDTVQLALARDPHPRPAEIPDDLREALERHDGALETFESLTASWRRSAIVRLEDARRASTRRKRIQRILDHVLDRQD